MTMFCNKPKLKETFTSFSILKNYRDGEDRVTRQQKKLEDVTVIKLMLYNVRNQQK